MTIARRMGDMAPLAGFALLLMGPGLAIRLGVLPFDLRFAALVAVFALCAAFCFFAGYSTSELGLKAPLVVRHWLGCGAVTLLLAAAVYLESRSLPAGRDQPNWTLFAPFYVLISSPCQEFVCRSVPKAIADRLGMGGAQYVAFSASTFSLMHIAYGDPLLLANTFFIGLAWAAAYLLTRNIWPVAASHAVVGVFAFWLGVA